MPIPKKRKRVEVEVEHSSDDSDAEAELEMQALRELQSHNESLQNNSDDDEIKNEMNLKNEEEKEDLTELLSCIEDLKQDVIDMPWIETVTIMAPAQSNDLEDPEDDLVRETMFYNYTLQSVKKGRQLLTEIGIQHRRPDDFFAEMVKTDQHMKRIKEQLVFEKSKMEKYAARRSDQDNRKFAKKVQQAKLKERKENKKQHMEALDKWRKRNKGSGKDEIGDDFDKYFFKNNNNNKPNKKREYSNKKFGHLGKPARLLKRNDSRSARDMTSYRAPNKGGDAKKRPGKNARNAKRRKRS